MSPEGYGRAALRGRYGEPVDDPIAVGPGVAIPLAEIEVRASRSSGPGGQHANVTASRVEAVFEIEASKALSADQKARLRARLGDRVTAVAQDARGQARNRALAIERLRSKLAMGLAVPRRRRRTTPGRGARERRLETKRRNAERKRARRAPRIDE
jgi:ribosome-associated protein